MSYAFTLSILVLASAEMEDKSFKQSIKYLNSYLDFLSLSESKLCKDKLNFVNFIIIYILILFHLIQFQLRVCTNDDEYLSALSPDNSTYSKKS